MPPLPKHPAARARRNRTSGAATLRPVENAVVPELPERRLRLEVDGDVQVVEKPWSALAVAWWSELWSSPMSAEYDASDLTGLVMLAFLVDDFFEAADPKLRKDLAAEVRQQGQRFGLSPIDRRRLQWEIDRGEEAEQRTSARRDAAKPKPRPAVDPRTVQAG